MLELSHIYKSYGPVHVLHDISLQFIPGEIMAILGPSGAGKTTLLQIAGTLDRPDNGKVTFDGKDLFKLKDKKLSKFRNKNIGFIFQFHQLLPEFSALENVALPALIAGKRKRESFADAKRLLEELGLSHRLEHKPNELSGGEKQRAAIARALINRPSIVFADEPTGSLDSRNRDEIKDIITGLREKYGQTFVVVTHDPSMAEIADRRVIMIDGKISEDSSAEISPDFSNFAEPQEEETADSPHNKVNIATGDHVNESEEATDRIKSVEIGDIFDYSMRLNPEKEKTNNKETEETNSENNLKE